jgi:hypothetical protein
MWEGIMHKNFSQRNHKRYPVMIPVEFHVQGDVRDGLIINKCKTGIFIKTGMDISVGEEIWVMYPFSKFGKKKRKGIITRATDQGVAVKFRETSS